MHYQFEPISDDNIFEEFCKDLFNSIYETKDFQLYKTKGAKQHGIDVYSLSHKIVIQCKKKKLLRSERELKEELISDLSNSLDLTRKLPFNFSDFILISTTKKFGDIEDEAAKLTESTGINIKFISWEDIEKHIITYQHLRHQYYPHLYTPSSKLPPKILNYLPHLRADLLNTRIEELYAINSCLEKSSNRIAVTGVGGIGKTTLSTIFIHNHIDNFDHILWIDQLPGWANSNVVDTFSQNYNLIKNLNIELSDEVTNVDRFKYILNVLTNLEGKNILIIDSATRQLLEYSNILPSSKNWTILINTRDILDGYTSVNLNPLSLEECLKLFYSYYQRERDDTTVVKILEYIDNHTLTIELLAKTAQKRSIKLGELSQLIDEDGLDLSKKAKVTTAHDLSSTPQYPFDYLLSIFSLLTLNDNHKKILQNLSILPSLPIPYKILNDLLDNEHDEPAFFDSLTYLVETGWIFYADDMYTMHPVIQEVIRYKLPSTDADGSCKILVDKLSQKLIVDFHQNPLEVSEFIIYAESVCRYVRSNTDKFIDLYIILGLRNEDIGRLENAEYYTRKAIHALEAKNTSEDKLATCYNNLHSILKTLGQIDESILYLNKAIHIQEVSLESFHPDLAGSYNNLSLLYKITGDIVQALKYQKLAIQICETTLDKNHPLLASTYANYSLLLHETGELMNAIRYQENAFEIRKLSLDKNHPLFAESYNNLSALYYDLGKLDLAKEYLKISIDIRTKSFGEMHYSLGSAYNNLAAMLLGEGQLNEAEKYQLLAIKIEESSLGEDHFELATTLGTLALIKFQQGDTNSANTHVNKALAILKKNFPNGHQNIDMLNLFKSEILGI